jgi:hypothetical protein
LNHLIKAIFCILVVAFSSWAQVSSEIRAPSVSLLPTPVFNVTRGKANSIELEFRVNSGFHINSNKPIAEYLVPTTLKLDTPTDLVVGKVTFPPGEDLTFAFAPDEKISVYSGDFKVQVQVRPLSNVLPTKYEFHGNLRYQACDNAQCFPPKQLPVRFEVKVIKAPPKKQANPAQSPHVHS